MVTLTEPTVKTTPTGAALGAVVAGVDASRPVGPQTILHLKQALLEHHLLLFQRQTLTDEQLLAFATYFGSLFVPPAEIPVLAFRPGEPPPIVVTIAHGAQEHEDLGNHELAPHSDHHWTPCPSSGALMHALEVPSQGGDTHWLNLVLAYEELDPATKERIADLQLITYNPFLSDHSLPAAKYRLAPQPLVSPVYPHPLVRTHPQSGQKILYLDADTEVEIVGLAPSEGAQLIETLRQHLNQPRFYYQHRWSVGDLVFWDNQSTLHYRPAFDPAARRVMKRVSLAGSRPF